MTRNKHPGQNETINPSLSKYNDSTLQQNNDTPTLPQKSDSTKISGTLNQQKNRKKANFSDRSASQSAFSLDNSELANIDKEESISNTKLPDNSSLRSFVLDLHCQKLNENFVFYGITEQTDEVTDDIVKAFSRTELEIVREIPIVQSYRIGKHFDDKIRPIVVKFENKTDRQDICFA
ncbi:unnamed protein product [Mytilus coruscus]|uniref:Uncharacterized protein n=1 Tax=Mytilus coruscus TaxID=42192 RepID=A0A6J8ELB2_MYTCO|nr:unnamed protein product [Mytilus coruscus]